mgnify:CR=1 FL=1
MFGTIRHKDNTLAAQHSRFIAQHVDLKAKASMGIILATIVH